MKKHLEILKNIKAEETELDAGVPVVIFRTAPPMINFLREKYLEDNTCMKGDIEFLFEFEGVGAGENDRYYRP